MRLRVIQYSSLVQCLFMIRSKILKNYYVCLPLLLLHLFVCSTLDNFTRHAEVGKLMCILRMSYAKLLSVLQLIIIVECVYSLFPYRI